MKRIVAIFLVLYSVPVWSYLFSSDYSSAIDKIVIDPGHGGKDPGSLGTGRYASNEKDIALDVALKFGKYIEESMPDVEVIYTRDSDDYPQLYERTALANREKADLFISIHCDAFTDSRASGSSSFVVGMNHGKQSRVAIRENPVIETEEDKLNYGNFNIHSHEYQIEVSLYQKIYEKNSLSLANKIQTQFRERVNRKDRGIKREPLYVTSRVAMPSVLVELGFLTNPKEEDFLNSEKGKTYMASALFRAFREYKDEQEGVINDVRQVQSMVSGDTDIPETQSRTYLSVQVFTSKKELKKKSLKGLETPFFIEENDTYKYFSGRYLQIDDVKKHQEHLKSNGFKDCFVVGIHDNAKVGVSEAMKLLK